MTIHRLLHRFARKYGKARTLCGLDVEGHIHPSAEVYSDGAHLPHRELREPECHSCQSNHSSDESRGLATVHALHHGSPLCGYGEGKPPGDWPGDQAWLSVTELGRHTGKDRPFWCETCLEKARAGNLPAAAAGTNALDHMRAPKNPSDGMKRFEVWSLRTIGNGGVDLRVGEAIENRDGSISVQLPALGVRLKLKAP